MGNGIHRGAAMARCWVVLALAGQVLASSPVLAADGPRSPAVRFDTRELESLGWRASADLRDFPLQREGRQTKLLAGFVHPDGPRIFVVYSRPSAPFPLRQIGVEPPESMLASMGIEPAKASGRYEEGFVAAYGLDALHWRMAGEGDGVSFLAGSAPPVATFGLMTLTSFVLLDEQGQPEPSLLTGFLRGPADLSDELIQSYLRFFASIAPQAAGATLLSPRTYASFARRSADAQLVREVERIVAERSGAIRGRSESLSLAQRRSLERFLEFFPCDPLVRRLLYGAVDAHEMNAEALAAYSDYLSMARKAAVGVAERKGVEAYLRAESERLDLERPAKRSERRESEGVTKAPSVLPGEEIVIELNGQRIAGVVPGVRPWEEGRSARLGELELVWHGGIETWLPRYPRAADSVLVRSGDEGYELEFRRKGAEGPGLWVAAQTLSRSDKRRLARSGLEPSCPKGTQLLPVAAVLRSEGPLGAVTDKTVDAWVVAGLEGAVLIPSSGRWETFTAKTFGGRDFKRATLAAVCGLGD